MIGDCAMGDSQDFGGPERDDQEFENKGEVVPGASARTKVSHLVQDVERQAHRLISLAAAAQADKSFLEMHIAAVRSNAGMRIMSRAEMDAFQLICVALNTHVYIAQDHPENADWICPDCFSDSVAVALRREPASEAGAARRVCPRCNFLIESGATSPI